MANLPSRRQDLEGETYDGVTLRLVYTVARNLYRCPGCHESVQIGAAHTLVHHLSADPPFYQHWHRECAARDLVRQLKTSRAVRAT